MKKKRASLWIAAVAAIVFVGNPAAAATYKIDTEHSSVSFKIRHLVSKTQGTFKKFSGTIDYNTEKPEKSSVKAEIDVGSIDTGVTKRDDHLRGPDFFNVTKNPTMKFETLKMTKVDSKGTEGQIVGKLTLNGVTKPVIIDVKMTGKAKDPFADKERVGFTGTTKINRQDFGMKWNLDDKQGGVVLGDEVEITLEIEAIQS